MDEYLKLHGGDVYSFIEETGRRPLDYSANINPLGLPVEVRNELSLSVDSYSNYPDVKCRKLREAVADFEQMDGERIVFGNGAADIIYRLCYALKPKRALLPAPTFVEYEQALSIVDCQVDYYYLDSSNGFQLTRDVLEQIKEKDIFFLCNPNNPTGMITDPKLLYQIAAKCKEESCTLVIDECFMDFVENQDNYSFKKYLPNFGNVIILRAFTKIFAMPGLRLGYCLCSDTDILRKIEKAGQCWSVSVPAQIAGVAALQSKDYLIKTLELITKERKYLTSSLRQLGITAYESYTNFILFRTEYKNLHQKLYERGILIRKCDNFINLDQTFYRIAVKDRANNEVLIKAMTEIIAI